MKEILFLFCVIALTGSPVFGETLGLEEVRVLALANSRSLAKSNMAVQSTILDEKSRIFSLLPSLSVGASASMSLWNSPGSEPLGNPLDTFSAGASAGVSAKIFDGGKSGIQKAINAIASESARQDALAEYFNVLDSADNAYYAALEAAATLEAEESSLQSAQASLAIAEIRQASGMINQGDYLKALADKESRENSRNQARRNLTLTIAKLKALTGLGEIPSLEPVDFSGYEDLILELGNISDPEAGALYTRFRQVLGTSNPSLAKSSLANQRAEKNLDSAKRGYAPSLNASFSTGLNFTQDSGVELSGGRVSLSASIPVDFWVINNNVEKSQIALESAALDYLSAETALDTELQSALLSTFAYAGSVLSSRRTLEYAEKHFEYVMERYRLSQSSVSELEEGATLLITSRNSLITSQYGFLRSLSQLRSLGALDNEEKLIGLLLTGS